MYNFCKKTINIPEKSAAPDAAKVAFLLSATPQTAPLCPSNVPTQSPVSPCRNIGLPSRINKDRHKKKGDIRPLFSLE